MTATTGGRQTRAVLLTNILAPYRLTFLAEVERLVGDLTVLISASSEPNREWSFDPGTLTVLEQRTISVRGRWKHRAGFAEGRRLHFPLDTSRRLRAISPEVIVSGELGWRTLRAIVFARRHQVPLICWVTLSEETEAGLGRLRTTLRRWMARRIDHWFVNGDSGQREVVGYGAEPDEITVLPQSTIRRSEVVAAPRRLPPPLRMLVVGQLIPRKQVTQLISALELAAPDGRMEVTIVGSGPLEAEVRAAASRSRLPMRVLGHLSYEEVVEVYGGFDVLAFPTLADEWGVVVNEAMSSGLAILGSNSSQAVGEMVRDGIEGIVFDPTPDGMREGILRLLDLSTDDLYAMRQAAADRARAYSVESIAPIMASTMHAVASGRDGHQA